MVDFTGNVGTGMGGLLLSGTVILGSWVWRSRLPELPTDSDKILGLYVFYGVVVVLVGAASVWVAHQEKAQLICPPDKLTMILFSPAFFVNGITFVVLFGTTAGPLLVWIYECAGAVAEDWAKNEVGVGLSRGGPPMLFGLAIMAVITVIVIQPLFWLTYGPSIHLLRGFRDHNT